MNTIKLGDKPVYDPPAGSPPCNWFEMHCGAARYGRGEFLMRRADYDALISANADGEVTLQMSANGSTGIEFNVVIAAALPYSDHVGAEPPGEAALPQDVCRVVVFDRRCRRTDRKTFAFNAQVQGFTQGTAAFAAADCYPSTLFPVEGDAPDRLWTWAEVFTKLEIPGGPTIPVDVRAEPEWTPRNLIFSALPWGRMIDDLASRLYLVVGYKPGDDTYRLHPPGGIHAANSTVASEAANFRIGSTQLGNLNKRRLPGKVYAMFPVRNVDSDDPYDETTHELEYVFAEGHDGTVWPLHVGEVFAIRQGDAWFNDAELTAIKDDLVPRFLDSVKQDPGAITYAGIWPFEPDGYYRGVRWVSDRHGARTELRINNDRDWSAMTDLQRSIDAMSNHAVVGLGSTSVSLGTGGTRYVWTQPQIALIRLSAIADGPGKYYGTLLGKPTVDIPKDTSLTNPELGSNNSPGAALGVPARAGDALVVNVREVGQVPATHDLAINGNVAPFVFIGVFLKTNAEGTPVYAIDGIQWQTCVSDTQIPVQ